MKYAFICYSRLIHVLLLTHCVFSPRRRRALPTFAAASGSGEDARWLMVGKEGQ